MENAQYSPTLVQDLKTLRERGIKIHWAAGSCRAYAPFFTTQIVISHGCSEASMLRMLAHEVSHVLIRTLPLPLKTSTTEEQFVDECLECETEALLHEAIICEELLSEGILVDSYAALTLMNKGGRAAIRQAVGSMITSTTGETYRDYYTRMFKNLTYETRGS